MASVTAPSSSSLAASGSASDATARQRGQSDSELTKWAHDCPSLRGHFIGVFSKDTIPRPLRNDECCIVNIESSHDNLGRPLPGTHWVAAGIHRNESWYFDSFGLAIPLEIRAVLRRPIFHRPTDVQGQSSQLCGLYALGACECVSSSPSDPPSQSLAAYYKQFDRPNLAQNDRVLHEYLASQRRHTSKTGETIYSSSTDPHIFTPSLNHTSF